jgi:predicted permease
MFRLPWRRDPKDFANEIQVHIAHEADRLVARGIPSDEARRRARVRFGNPTLATERTYEASRLLWLETVAQDVRYGARQLARSPAFAVTAVFVLALGIGVSTALFSIVNSLFLRHVNVPDPERLVYVNGRDEWGQLGVLFQRPTEALRDTARDLADFTAHWNVTARVAVGDTTTILPGELVTSNYFAVVGAPFELGGPLRPEDDDVSNVERSIVIGHDARVTLFGERSDVLGSSVRVDARTYRVVGVTAPGFTGLASPWEPSVWWTTAAAAADNRVVLRSVARLKPRVSIAQLQAALLVSHANVLQRQWEEWAPATRDRFPHMRRRSVAVAAVNDVQIPNQPERRLIPTGVLVAVVIVVGLVLVIASANVAGLLLARGVSRTGEIAMRQALGAGRLRLFRQVVTESLLLSALGALAGAGVSVALVRLFSAATPAKYATFAALDARVLLFAAAVCVVTGLVTGLAPAAESTKVELLQVLGVGVVGARRTGGGLRRSIVIPQVAMSLVLLLVAAAHVRALHQIESADLGYRTRNVAVLGVGTWKQDKWLRRPYRSESAEAEALEARRFARAVLQQAAGAEGTAAFAMSSRLPLSDAGLDQDLLAEQEAFRAGDGYRVPATFTAVSDGYFDAMGIRVLAGRPFDGRDGVYDDYGRRVAVVSASAARQLAPGGDILGRNVAVVPPGNGSMDWLTVIGIVNDVDPLVNDGRAHPAIYGSLHQQWRPVGQQLIMRASGSLPVAIAAMKSAVLGADPFAEVTSVRTLDEMTDELLYPRRLGAAILVMAGAIGLVLSCIGIYGVVSYSAAQRTRELGIRATLGATGLDILGLVLREGAVVLGFATVSGMVLAFIALRVSAGTIKGLPTPDPITFAVVPIVLAAVVLAASLAPALRAARTDPSVVMRGE